MLLSMGLRDATVCVWQATAQPLPQWLVVSGQWSVASGQWSVVSGQWSVVSGQWSSAVCVVGEVSHAHMCASERAHRQAHACSQDVAFKQRGRGGSQAGSVGGMIVSLLL